MSAAASEQPALDNLRLVLLGNPGVGKSCTANVILGTETFREAETTECEIQRGTVDGRTVSIIDTPGINSPVLSPDQLKTEVRRCLSLSAPGPHVFLLVIRVKRFTEDMRNTVTWIQENFGEEALKSTLVLFTGKEDMTNSQWTKFSQDAEMLGFVKNCGFGYCGINSKRELNPAQVTKLLEKIETRVQESRGQHYSNETYEAVQRKRAEDEERRRRRSEDEKHHQKDEKHQRNVEEDLESTVITPSAPPQDVPRRREEEDVIPEQDKKMKSEDDEARRQLENEVDRKSLDLSVMMEAFSIKEHLMGQKEKQKGGERGEEERGEEERGAAGGATPDPESDLRIVLLGTSKAGKSASGNTILGREAFGKNINPTAESRRQAGRVGNKVLTVIDTKGVSHRAGVSDYCELFEESLSLSAPGPHVFLIVINSPRILNNTFYPLISSLGGDFMQRALILLTHGDVWGTDHKRVLNNLNLKRLVHSCGGDYQIFNNMRRDERAQVTELLEKIETLVQMNGGKHYTNEMYLEAQRKRMEERVGVLEEKVDVLSLKNEQLSTVIRQSQRRKSESDGCCLL